MKSSIRNKTLYWILIIFLTTFIMITLVIGRIIRNNNAAIIERDISSQTKSLNLFLNQYIISNDINDQKNKIDEIGTVLSLKFNKRIIIYSNSEDVLFDSIYESGNVDYKHSLYSDFYSALKNQISYTLIRNKNTCIAAISVPLSLNNDNSYVLRYFIDYSYLSDITDNLFKNIEFSLLMMFIVLFIFTAILTKKITRPLIQLTHATKRISKGDFSSSINITTNDEIETLGDNFTLMKDKINSQITEIKDERDNLIKVQNYKKLFFDNVTHELKTPLTIISGYSQILKTHDLKDESFVRNRLQRIDDESQKMHRMILDLLDISIAESEIQYNFENFNLSTMLKNTIEDMSISSSKKDISIESSIEESLNVTGDKSRLRQCITNVLDNAIKYSPKNSSIQVSLIKDEDFYVLLITDQGYGISAKDIDNLSKPFFRLHKSNKNSSGLGLYIVKLIMDKHGGLLDVTSEEGKGTKVFLKIPINVYKMAKTQQLFGDFH